MDATERYFTREAERAARKLVGQHRAQERRKAREGEELERERKATRAAAYGVRPSESGTRGRRGMR